MENLTRWQQFFQDDPSLVNIPHSHAAELAAARLYKGQKRVVLEVGCGTGRDTVYLAEKGLRVTGLDASRKGLLLANSRKKDDFLQVCFVEGDALTLPFNDHQFDGVYSFGLLHEFVGEGSWLAVERTIAEIDRVL